MEDNEELRALDDSLLVSTTADELFLHMEYFPSHMKDIELQTKGQSSNPLWCAIRKHVITASKAHAVKTTLASIYKVKSEGKVLDLSSIFKKRSGEGPSIDQPSLEYGQAMESEALSIFLTTFKNTPKKAKASDCGIFICKDRQFIGGSPGHIFQYECCGKFCNEIKCPFSIRDKSPNDAESELIYLEHNNHNMFALKRNHTHFMQCQIQMGVTGIGKSYFVVWAAHGPFAELIEFDKDLWETSKNKLEESYFDYYVPSFFYIRMLLPS